MGVGNSDKPQIPRLLPDADVMRLPLGPADGFVLSRIDGITTIEEIADMCAMPEGDVKGVVQRLVDEGVAEWVDPLHPRTVHPGPRGTPARGTGRGIRTRPPPEGGTQRELYDPQELEEPDVDLDMERRRRILDTFYRLDDLTFYELLDVPQDADKAQIRSAYFTLSKQFHPDTLYGKRLGGYKRKMEVVFQRLTEAYEVLGKKRSRQKYDDYVQVRQRTRSAQVRLRDAQREAERIERGATQAVSRAVVDPTLPDEAAAPDAPGAEAAGASSAQSEPQRSPSAAGRARAKALMARKLAAATGRRLPGSKAAAKPATEEASRPATPTAEAAQDGGAGRDEVLRGLATSLKRVAGVTGGVNPVNRQLDRARRAEEAGELVEAVHALRLATAMAGGREDVEREYRRVSGALARSLADSYAAQARYEEERQHWVEAAISWSRVTEGRPRDVEAHWRAARAMIEAGGDLAGAKQLAQKAVDLAPEDPDARRILGRVYIEAGMTLNARRELERAAKLDPSDEIVKNLLRELAQRK